MVKRKKLVKTSSKQDMTKTEIEEEKGFVLGKSKEKEIETNPKENEEEKADSPGDNKEKIDAILAVKEEKAREARKKQAGTGIIPDARVFQLMYLEKCAVEASLQIQVRKSSYERRIEALRQEANGIVRQWEVAQKKSIRRISEVRREVEDDYGIFMNQWGYEEETGVLQRIPEEAKQETDLEKNDDKLSGEVKNTSDKSSE